MKTQPDWVDIALLRPLPEDFVCPKERMIPVPRDCVVMRFIAKMQKRLEPAKCILTDEWRRGQLLVDLASTTWQSAVL